MASRSSRASYRRDGYLSAGAWLADPTRMVRVEGELDPEGGEAVLTALQAMVDAELRAGGGRDLRTPAQRRADALCELAPPVPRQLRASHGGRGAAPRHGDRGRADPAQRPYHWADGGQTALHNLVLLCRPHHRLVHEGGFRLQLVDGRPVFRRPDGSVIEDGRAPP
ncbi:MAG TPA: HNH endonuclease signature motif containing protein [Actinomycetota bacterium]|nr:HNH endonuclease signature motif containing protein [Actinomycetota bacterium]